MESGLQAKLAVIQDELKVAKTKKNNAVAYEHRNAGEILEKVKPLLKQQGLLLTITHGVTVLASQHQPSPVVMRNAKGDERTEIVGGDRFYIICTGTLTDIESKDSIQITAVAREPQNKLGLDESQITGAAQSYSKKYMLEDMFSLDNNKDNDDLDKGKEADTYEPKSQTPSSPVTATQYKTIQELNGEPDRPQSSREAVAYIRELYEQKNRGNA